MCISPRQILNPYWTSVHYKPRMRYHNEEIQVHDYIISKSHPERKVVNSYSISPSGYYLDEAPNVSPITKQIKNLSKYIEVPCGDCPQCKSRKQTDLLQRVQMESLDSYCYMFTLTYNKNVPKYSLPNGKVLMRADYKHVVDMFKRIRKADYFQGRRFKYLVCSEYATKHARPHFHGILFLKKHPSDGRLEYVNLEKLAFDTILKEWRINVARRVAKTDTKKYKKGDIIVDTRNPEYLPLLDYKRTFRNGQWRSTYDLHYITPNSKDGTNDVSFYVMKYLFKEGKGEKFVQACCYKSLQSKIAASKLYGKEFKSFNHKSLNLGCSKDDFRPSKSDQYFNEYWPDKKVLDYILKCARMSKVNNLPLSYFDIYTGKRMPMCDYYAKMLSIPMQIEFAKDMRRRIDSGELRENTYESYSKVMSKFKQRSKLTFVTDIFDDDLLFNEVSLEDDMPDFEALAEDSPDVDFKEWNKPINLDLAPWCGDLPGLPYVSPVTEVIDVTAAQAAHHKQLTLNLS